MRKIVFFARETRGTQNTRNKNPNLLTIVVEAENGLTLGHPVKAAWVDYSKRRARYGSACAQYTFYSEEWYKWRGTSLHSSKTQLIHPDGRDTGSYRS